MTRVVLPVEMTWDELVSFGLALERNPSAIVYMDTDSAGRWFSYIDIPDAPLKRLKLFARLFRLLRA